MAGMSQNSGFFSTIDSDGDNAVLFADIVGSSKIYQKMGNSRAQREVDRLLTLMIQIVQAHGGQLVKTIGDEIMVIFSDAECAAESAIALNLKVQEQGYAIRTGLAFGDLIFDGDDVFGNTVNRAASLVRAAHSRQILLDQSLFEELPFWLLNYCDLYDRLILKGSDHKALVYRLNWQAEDTPALDITQVSGSLVTSKTHYAQELELSVRGQMVVITAGQKPITLGRDPAVVDFVIPDPKISRLHCIISFSRGKFIFEDRSTNGSYVQENGHPEIYLRRESAPLVDCGKISLGQPSRGSHEVVKFRHLSTLAAQTLV